MPIDRGARIRTRDRYRSGSDRVLDDDHDDSTTLEALKNLLHEGRPIHRSTMTATEFWQLQLVDGWNAAPAQ